MEELIKIVAEKAGIDPATAKTAVETVMAFIKTRLPASVAGQVEQAIGGGAGGLGEVAKKIGGLFGK